ncbi:hypothetical protein PRIPAC_96771, partial [Pristionchus pacificus]|uniref:G protein-coupled receptor n=1 Tax=Pristionchus pacificus TaxID=54126 RepID=A0A2A6B369_PRIPA
VDGFSKAACNRRRRRPSASRKYATAAVNKLGSREIAFLLLNISFLTWSCRAVRNATASTQKSNPPGRIHPIPEADLAEKVMSSALNATVLITTTLKPCSRNWMNIWKQLISAPLGGASWILNAILLAAILCNRRLRAKREYWLMMALSCADFSEGIASFIGAVYRLPFYYSDTACYAYTTPLQCMVLPHNIIWRWSDTATAFMLVATALDRFIAITNPTFYVIRSKEVVIVFVYGISVLCMLYAWIMPIQLQIAGVKLQAVCGTGGLIDKVYTQVIKYATGAMSALSVLIHLFVAYKVRIYMKRMAAMTNFGEKPKISKRELKFTITSLIKGLCTLILDSSTRIYGVYAMVEEGITGVNPESSGMGSFLFAFNKMNGVLNVFVYAGGQKELDDDTGAKGHPVPRSSRSSCRYFRRRYNADSDDRDYRIPSWTELHVQVVESSAPYMAANGMIEEQIRQVDKIIKLNQFRKPNFQMQDCDNSRKSLDSICRRLDDLNDEVKRYRDFLGHEKSRRDPALYKTSNCERPSAHNENICGTLNHLTAQLTMEWYEKLNNLTTLMQTATPTSNGRGSNHS